PIEAAADRIDRLVSELSAALDEEYGGDYEAVIGPSGAVSYRWAYPSPQQRVEESISELKSALVELDAGPVRAVVSSDTGALVEKLEGKPFMRGVPPVLWRIA